MPIGVQKEGLRQCARRRQQVRLHLPAAKNVSPARAEFHGGLKLAQTGRRPAGRCHRGPRGRPRKRDIGDKASRWHSRPSRSKRKLSRIGRRRAGTRPLFGELLGLASILIADKSDPFTNAKTASRMTTATLKIGRNATNWAPRDRFWPRESHCDHGYRHQNKDCM